jgi:hypothetical protein
MGVLRHHAHELPPISLRHPVLGLDALAARDPRFELGDSRRIVGCVDGTGG